jgi:potassium efflux system protein
VLLWTGLVTVLWPSAIGYVGLRVFQSPVASEFILAIAQGLYVTALVFLPLEFFRQMCRKGGLGELHFDWNEHVTGVLRRNLRWLIFMGLPLLFIVAVTEHQSSEQIQNSLGRVAFLGLMIVLGVCLFRVTRPVHGILDRAQERQLGAWWSRLARVTYWIAVGTPVALAVLAFFDGYDLVDRRHDSRPRPADAVAADGVPWAGDSTRARTAGGRDQKGDGRIPGRRTGDESGCGL